MVLCLAMKKKYNLDIDHVGVNFPPFNSLPVPFHCQQTPLMDVKPIPSVSHQQVTVFFNGRPFICDMTELQARAIILFASREMEERRDTQDSKLALSVCLQSQICGSSQGLSIKRSLQRFLQKRKQRTQLSSPYNYQKPA